MNQHHDMPVLIPVEAGEFWKQIRQIVRDEMLAVISGKNTGKVAMETPGLTQKPLYKISEVCVIFNITRPTVYEWIKAGKLRPVKIRSRVYFLGSEIQALLK